MLWLTTRTSNHRQFWIFAKLSTKLARLGASVSATDLASEILGPSLAISEGASYKVDLSLLIEPYAIYSYHTHRRDGGSIYPRFGQGLSCPTISVGVVCGVGKNAGTNYQAASETPYRPRNPGA